MDSATVFARTVKGEEELKTRRYGLSLEDRRGLILVDGKSNYGLLQKKAMGLSDLEACLKTLLESGFIAITKKAGWGGLKEELITVAVEILGEKNADRVIKKIQAAPDTKEGIEETVKGCKKLVKLVIDEKKADKLITKCAEVMARHS